MNEWRTSGDEEDRSSMVEDIRGHGESKMNGIDGDEEKQLGGGFEISKVDGNRVNPEVLKDRADKTGLGWKGGGSDPGTASWD